MASADPHKLLQSVLDDAAASRAHAELQDLRIVLLSQELDDLKTSSAVREEEHLAAMTDIRNQLHLCRKQLKLAEARVRNEADELDALRIHSKRWLRSTSHRRHLRLYPVPRLLCATLASHFGMRAFRFLHPRSCNTSAVGEGPSIGNLLPTENWPPPKEYWRNAEKPRREDTRGIYLRSCSALNGTATVVPVHFFDNRIQMEMNFTAPATGAGLSLSFALPPTVSSGGVDIYSDQVKVVDFSLVQANGEVYNVLGYESSFLMGGNHTVGMIASGRMMFFDYALINDGNWNSSSSMAGTPAPTSLTSSRPYGGRRFPSGRL